MTKVEKAIKELHWLQFNFPWQDNPENDADKMCNAIHKYAGDAIELLEEREPAVPKELNMYPRGVYACGACGHAAVGSNDYRAKFCPECGRALKWE